MADLTPETLAAWRQWVDYHRNGAGNNEWNRTHEPHISLRLNEFEALLDALDDAERTIAKRSGSLDMAIASAKRRLTRAEKAEREARQRKIQQAEQQRVIDSLKDSLAAEKARAEQAEAERDEWKNRPTAVALTAAMRDVERAEAALSRVLADMKALGMRADGIVDADGGRWVPCTDVLDLIEKYRACGTPSHDGCPDCIGIDFAERLRARIAHIHKEADRD